MNSGSGSSGISVGNISGNSVVLGATVVVGSGVVSTTGSEVVTGIAEDVIGVDEGTESVDVANEDDTDVEESVIGVGVDTAALERLEVVTVFQE